jgi:4-amino-4-deoxy-L-arabinose transferase-like glycosyltransferase
VTAAAAGARNGRLRLLLALIVAALAVYPAWLTRFVLQNDTVSYLDMGSLFFSGHFARIVNGTWGPLYAMLLGAWLRLLRPTPQWEYPWIHLLLFLVFLFCIACFDAFLAALLEFRERQSASDERDDGSGPALTIIGYAIFAWATLILVTIQETNPDMLVAAFLFLACACTLRIHSRGASWGAIGLLGLAAAGGYLTKAAFLPVGALLIAAAAIAGPDLRSKLRVGGLAALVAGLLALPYVAALSIQRGRLTFTQTGQYNYAVHVNGVADRHWQGETPGAGQPVHPTRQLLHSPAVFEFATPLPGTYPYWFDPSYWYEGVETPFDWTHQKRATLGNAEAFVGLAFAINCAPLSLLILLQSLALRRKGAVRRTIKYWIVLLPAAVALVPYVLIHWETRYLAGSLCVLMVTAIASARLPALPQTRQVYAAAAVLVVVLFFLPGGPSSTASTLGFWQAVRHSWPQSENVYWRAASALHEAGYPEGTKVATIEFGDMTHVLWARLARVQIVAEVYYRPEGQLDHYPRENQEPVLSLFWDSPLGARQRALLALKSAGARVVVTTGTPRGPGAEQWRQLDQSGYYYAGL